MFSLEENYEQAIRISHNIVEDIRFGRNLYLEPVEMCSYQICMYPKEDAEIFSFLSSVKDKHPYLYSHPVHVAFLSFLIGRWMNMDCLTLERLVCTGFLHDIGKAKIKDSLLNKAETLTLEEMEKMKSHPVIGYKILKERNDLDLEVLQGVLFHHERMDGSGYPLRLRGEKINLFSRIIAVADTFDAITASKAYGVKKSPIKAAEEIQAESINHLDPNICHIFINNLMNYNIDEEAQLNNEAVDNIQGGDVQ